MTASPSPVTGRGSDLSGAHIPVHSLSFLPRDPLLTLPSPPCPLLPDPAMRSAPCMPCPSLAVLCFSPTHGCLADVYVFKKKFILLQERLIWRLFRARQHGYREKADPSLPSSHQGEQRRNGQESRPNPWGVLRGVPTALGSGGLPLLWLSATGRGGWPLGGRISQIHTFESWPHTRWDEYGRGN